MPSFKTGLLKGIFGFGNAFIQKIVKEGTALRRTAGQEKVSGKGVSEHIRTFLTGLDEWCVVFLRDDLERSLKKLSRESVTGGPRQMHDESEAVRLLELACSEVGLIDEETGRREKNDLRKEMIAWSLRKKTPLGLEWIAGRLEMDSRANVSRAIRKAEESTDREIQRLKLKPGEMYGCAH